MNPRENILLIRLKSIGDVILTLPAVHVVRENFPSAKITFLTSKENVPLLQGFREVDEVIALDRATLRGGNPLKVVPEFFALLRKLRGGKFSRVVDFQGYGETAWLARFTGARQRWGLVFKPGRGWAYTRRVAHDPDVPVAEYYPQLLAQCGLKLGTIRNEFILPPAAADAARAWFADNRLAVTQPTLYLQPFTSSPHKNWPFENYLALAQNFRRQGVQVIVGGGPADRPLLERARDSGCTISAGLPRLTDAGLMKFSSVIAGGDTGFLHLAVALGRRVVMLMKVQGPGSAVPFRHPEWVVAPPAGLPVAQISFEKMLAATTAALASENCKK